MMPGSEIQTFLNPNIKWQWVILHIRSVNIFQLLGQNEIIKRQQAIMKTEYEEEVIQLVD